MGEGDPEPRDPGGGNRASPKVGGLWVDPSLPPAPEEEGVEMEAQGGAQGGVKKMNKNSARNSHAPVTQIYLLFSQAALSFTLSHGRRSLVGCSPWGR